jgi:hypothetical protein
MASDISSVKQENLALVHARELVASGRYALLSWDALGYLSQVPSQNFPLSSQLLQRCSFVAKAAFEQRDAGAFLEAVAEIDGFAPPKEDGKQAPAAVAEEFKLRNFMKREKFLENDDRVMVSTDLIGEMTPSADKPCLTLDLLARCVFVAKDVFSPQARKRFLVDISDGESTITKYDRLSTAVASLQQLREAARKELEEDESFHLVYKLMLRTQ